MGSLSGLKRVGSSPPDKQGPDLLGEDCGHLESQTIRTPESWDTVSTQQEEIVFFF